MRHSSPSALDSPYKRQRTPSPRFEKHLTQSGDADIEAGGSFTSSISPPGASRGSPRALKTPSTQRDRDGIAEADRKVVKSLGTSFELVIENDYSNTKSPKQPSPYVSDTNHWPYQAIVVLWYATSLTAMITSQMFLNRFPLPVILSTLQYLFASVYSFIYLKLTRGIRSIPGNARSYVLIVAIFSTLVTVLTNASYDAGTIAFSEAQQSFNLSWLTVLKSVFSSGKGAIKASVSFIMYGAGWVLYAQDTGYGIIAVGSLLSFGAGTLYSIKTHFALKIRSLRGHCFEDLNMFAVFSVIGLLISIALLTVEAPKIWSLIQNHDSFVVDLTPLQFGILVTTNVLTSAFSSQLSLLILGRAGVDSYASSSLGRHIIGIIGTSIVFLSDSRMQCILGLFWMIIGAMSCTYVFRRGSSLAFG